MTKKSRLTIGIIAILVIAIAISIFFFTSGQIFVSRSTIYADEETTIQFYCGLSDDRVQTCNVGELVYVTLQRQSSNSLIEFSLPLKSSNFGKYISFTQSFRDIGIYDVDFCVGIGFSRCESKIGLINVIGRATPTTIPSTTTPTTTTTPTPEPTTSTTPTTTSIPAPSCSTRWTCKDEMTKAYKNSDCSWSNLETCTYGCDNGVCRPPPPSSTSIPISTTPSTTPTSICPTACTPLWETKLGTCLYVSCGSGCGADNKSTFASKEACEASLSSPITATIPPTKTDIINKTTTEKPSPQPIPAWFWVAFSVFIIFFIALIVYIARR